VHQGSGYAVAKAKIESDGKAVCSAELMFRLMPFPAEMAKDMRKEAERIGLAPEPA
jgi:3-hydroxyacyl-[acyl-carrier-protein] dehydratase